MHWSFFFTRPDWLKSVILLLLVITSCNLQTDDLCRTFNPEIRHSCLLEKLKQCIFPFPFHNKINTILSCYGPAFWYWAGFHLSCVKRKRGKLHTTIFMHMFRHAEQNVSIQKHIKECIRAAIQKCQCFNDAPAVHSCSAGIFMMLCDRVSIGQKKNIH